MNEKEWYLSKAVWGGIIAIVAGISAAFGYDVDVVSQEQIVTQVVAVVGGGLALYGRIKSTTKIKK